MTEHIEESQLNTDVDCRFNYFTRFVNFTSEDIESLNKFALVALPMIPVLVDSVYRRLFQFDITKNFFILHNDAFDGSSNTNENLSLDSAQMIFRRDMLSSYLKRLFLQGQWTHEFIEYLSRIGKMHTNQMGSASINVDFIHINVTLTFIENFLIEFVFSNENFDQITKKQILLALNKVFRIQTDLFLMHYLQPNQDNSTKKQAKDKCICS